MAAVRGRLDPTTSRSVGRTATRRKLRLEAQGFTAFASANVLILDISTTGILLQTTGDLSVDEIIELDLPRASGSPLVVKWSSGELFGCQFKEPVSAAIVSGALLRASPGLPDSEEIISPDTADFSREVGEADGEGKLPLEVRMRWIVGLVLLSWALVAAMVLLAWQYLH